MNKKIKACAAVISVVFVVSCVVPNRPYRLGPQSVISPSNNRVGCNPATDNPCLAFLEFDDMGEMFDPTQVQRAMQLISEATSVNPNAVIVTFIHGWKNNAEEQREHTGNVYGFEQVLKFLAGKYSSPLHKVPIVGIYVGWRGELVSKYWPLRRQFSYFNRESAAIRIPGASMTDALMQITQQGHRAPAHAIVILVGHSFGGLVLERALTQAMVEQVVRPASTGNACGGATIGAPNDPAMVGGSTQSDTKGGENKEGASKRPGANLVVFLNSAAAATQAKQMLDVMTSIPDLSYKNPENCESLPLFLSISSLGDAATRFAMPIGHGLSFLALKSKGSLRNDDPLVNPKQPTSQGSFYMSTAAHMGILQSHLVLKDTDTTTAPGAKVFRKFKLPDTGEAYKIVEKPNRWNGTPYWLMEVPAEIIPDHSTIFTERCIQLLSAFLPTNEQVNRPETRPVLTNR